MSIFIYLVSSFFLFGVFFLMIFIFCYSLFFGGCYYKNSPFECGFQPFSEISLSFSMPFFLVSLMFLVFDIEIILVCLYPLSNWFFLSFYVYYLIVFLILVFTILEWFKGILSWV